MSVDNTGKSSLRGSQEIPKRNSDGAGQEGDGSKGSVGGGNETRRSGGSFGNGGPSRPSVGSNKRSSGGSQRSGQGQVARGSYGSQGRVSLGAEQNAPDYYAMPEGGYYGEMEGEVEMMKPECPCDPEEGPCDCKTPPEPEEEEMEDKKMSEVDQSGEVFQLDEFMRAKSYFLQTSSKSGLNMYDHLSDVIRKFLDDRAPNNPVDYLEEVSMNIKRYRFGIRKNDPLQDAFYISEPVLQDAKRLESYWKTFARWNEEKKEIEGESGLFMGGSFQNLLRLQYYLEQVTIGLPREEMFRIALGIKELSGSRTQIGRLRFWGKIFGTSKNYYVVEAELKFGGTEQEMDLWVPKDDNEEEEVEDEEEGAIEVRSKVPKKMVVAEEAPTANPEPMLDAKQTFSRAKDVVLNHDFLTAFSKTSGLPPEKQAEMLPKPTSYYMPGPGAEWEGEDGNPDNMMEFEDPEARAEAMKWEGYQQELMDNFPQTSATESLDVPMEPDGTGVNRRVFYVCNDLGNDWVLLPPVTPQQINSSRTIRWFLTGNLNSKVKSIPAFPGKEGHYLKALLARITAGGMTTPKGYYRPRPTEGEIPGEEDDDELEPEDDELPPVGNDAVQAVKKYNASMKALTNPNMTFWVHHTAMIIPQGRCVWWNPNAAKQKRKGTEGSEEGSDEEDDDEFEDEDDDEEEGEGKNTTSDREVPARLFSPISDDKAPDGKSPWTMLTSSTVFQEFQVVSIRSNVWTGSNVICTVKGKVNNIYLGDGLKFAPITYCPPVAIVASKEYRSGPELEETPDPTVDAEQSWLDKLALNEIADVEAKFEDNEEDEDEEEEEEDETEYED